MKLKNLFKNVNFWTLLALLLALFTGYLHQPVLYGVANGVSEIFINLLKLVSVPIIFLSIVSTISGMDNLQEFKSMGKRVLKYTILTTVLASTVALSIFLVIDPVQQQFSSDLKQTVQTGQKGYIDYLFKIIPSNMLQPFLENHVIGVLFLAVVISLAILTLPLQQRTLLHSVFSSVYQVIMKLTSWVVWLMPIAIWSFVTLFIKDMRGGLEIGSIALYLACVLLANLIQGLVVLPTFIKLKGVSPIKLAKSMLPALSVAFFTKSSSATLPFAMRCCEMNAGLSRKTVDFTMPLCTTINMNGCAAFILITVLFVSMSYGVTYSLMDQIAWIFVATIAAIGNAGVPMGCFFLSSALLASLNVPLNILGVILPFYTLVDMVETSLNVWSDSCVVAVVDREITLENAIITSKS